MKIHTIFISCSVIAFFACNSKPDIADISTTGEAVQVSAPKDFVQYWYGGKAEVNSYNLEQSRYGETRQGDAVMVFVTEDFSKSKQVKLDYPKQSARDAVSVLKLNALKKFQTGIYDYSIMQSVFTPVDIKSYPNTFKTTFSSQDWCGHVFSQINLDKDGSYRSTDFSYFESEGDTDRKLKNAMLEDEIWTRIRINPESIPIGQVKLIPSQGFARLDHQPIKPTSARVELIKKTESASELKIEYLHFNRSVTIDFQSDFPYKILGWEEKNGTQPPTKAILKETIHSAYWGQHDNKHAFLRDSLKLRF